MSAKYDNTNSGALFRNERATTDKHPTHTGKINVEGRDYYLNAWVKEGKKGKFFSLSVKPVDEQPGGHPNRFHNQRPGRDEPDSSDIPF
jgi:hypothetical protein